MFLTQINNFLVARGISFVKKQYIFFFQLALEKYISCPFKYISLKGVCEK